MSMQNSLEAQLPYEYNEISQTLESADLILNNAVENAKTLFHTLAVSSIDNNQIATRVMVLSCLLYTSPSPRDVEESRMPSSA